jgi:ferric-dicitrate binding protein FerR (iron transport regulator)
MGDEAMSHEHDGDEPYLWDRSGEPDPDVAKLEALLRPLSIKESPVPLPQESAPPRPTRGRFATVIGGALALAAAVAIGFFAGKSTHSAGPNDVHAGIGTSRSSMPSNALPTSTSAGAPTQDSPSVCPSTHPPDGALAYAVLMGTATCDGASAPDSGFLPLGRWLETDGSSRIMLEVADIGRVEIAPRSKLRILAGKGEEHRLELDHGVIHARINAPPRLFVVETQAATAVDLGCIYTLEIGDDGRGVLAVSRGEVALEKDAGSVVVERGQMAEMRPGHRPGTPFAGDASVELRRALGAWDFDSGALQPVLTAATANDALTLVGVLDRATTPADRVATFDRIGALVPLPKTFAHDAIAEGNPAALHAVREAVLAKH